MSVRRMFAGSTGDLARVHALRAGAVAGLDGADGRRAVRRPGGDFTFSGLGGEDLGLRRGQGQRPRADGVAQAGLQRVVMLLGMLYHCLQNGLPYNESAAFPTAATNSPTVVA